MTFHPFDVTTTHIIYACLGGFIVLFGMFSLFLRSRLYIGEALWAFLFGVIIGPFGADIVNPRDWASDEEGTNVIVLEVTRVVLAIGVFAIGVELPKAYMKKHWRTILFLLVPVMTWGWFVSAALIFALIPGLNFLSSLAVAACLTPTDPILAAAVVGGKWADKHVPAHIRHMLAAESGCNDGAAFPFLFIALYLSLDAPNTGHAVRDWFLLLWLYQVILGTIIGALLGFGFRHLMKFCQRRDLIDRHSYVAQYVSLAMLTIGVCTLLGSDDLLAAFACGTAFAWDGFFNRQTEESNFSSVIDLLFNIACFIFIGAWMPFSSFQDEVLTLTVWRLIVIAILVLLLRRLPVMIALYRWIPDIKTFREAVFSGHFGPIGVGAVFISTLAVEVIHKNHHPASDDDLHDDQVELLAATIQPIVAFLVLCSITIHGLSIPSFSLGRRVHSVSRTWSRQNTAASSEVSWWSTLLRKGNGRTTAAQPEWATQATIIERPEDIIINRDYVREMEEGRKSTAATCELDIVKSEEKPELPCLESSRPVSRVGSRVGLAAPTAGGSGSPTSEMRAVDATVSRAATPGAPPTPAGDESPPVAQPGEVFTYTEWKEGKKRVVERTGPTSADDIEILVKDAPEDEHKGSTLARPVEWVREHSHSLTRLRSRSDPDPAPAPPPPPDTNGSSSGSGSALSSRPRSVDGRRGDNGRRDSVQQTLVHESSEGDGNVAQESRQRISGNHERRVDRVVDLNDDHEWQSRGRQGRGSTNSSCSQSSSQEGGMWEDAPPEEERRGRRGSKSTFGRGFSAGANDGPGTEVPSTSGAEAPMIGTSELGRRRSTRTRSADPGPSGWSRLRDPSSRAELEAGRRPKHHRVESIMVSYAATPSAGPTRESSPSRSVRFADRIPRSGHLRAHRHGVNSVRSMERLGEGGGDDDSRRGGRDDGRR